MKHIGPPAWMERLLFFLLPGRDRETVVGDLYEEFCDRRASRLGPVRTNLWYLIQTVSFVPRRCRSASFKPLVLLCIFTALCGCWLGAMDFRMRHPGYLGQAGIAAGILLQALLTLSALHFRRSSLLRRLSMLGCVILYWLSGRALIATIRDVNPEGYVFLIAVALLFQASLTLAALRRGHKSGMLV